MSKFAHSNQETMDQIDLERAIDDDALDLILDHHAGLHLKYGVDKLINALKQRRGTSLRYPEVRAICAILVK